MLHSAFVASGNGALSGQTLPRFVCQTINGGGPVGLLATLGFTKTRTHPSWQLAIRQSQVLRQLPPLILQSPCSPSPLWPRVLFVSVLSARVSTRQARFRPPPPGRHWHYPHHPGPGPAPGARGKSGFPSLSVWATRGAWPQWPCGVSGPAARPCPTPPRSRRGPPGCCARSPSAGAAAARSPAGSACRTGRRSACGCGSRSCASPGTSGC